jgi:hypothetical protein
VDVGTLHGYRAAIQLLERLEEGHLFSSIAQRRKE